MRSITKSVSSALFGMLVAIGVACPAWASSRYINLMSGIRSFDVLHALLWLPGDTDVETLP